MSWYNNTANNFIDATQIYEGGAGSGGGSIVINNGDEGNTGNNSTISDLITLKFENGLFNLYVNNKNENGVIYLNTSGNDNKIKIENGKLYLYYDYDVTNAPLIPAGWTDIINYSTFMQNEIMGLATNLALIDTTLYAPTTGLNTRFPITEAMAITATNINVTQDSRLVQLELDIKTLIRDRPQILEYSQQYDEVLDNIRNTMGANSTEYQLALRDVALGGGATLNVARSLALSRQNFILHYFNSILTGIGGFSLAVAVIFGIYDRISQRNLIDEEEKLLLTYEKIKDNPDSLINNLIYLNGLQIKEATNYDFLTSGIYEININYNSKLKIEIKNINGELKAVISDVIYSNYGFNVGDIIIISKSNLGGSISGTGNLEIEVLNLINERNLIAQKLNNILISKNTIDNNNRRRQNIPNKNDFTDGLEIIESTTTENTGEVLDKIEIKLKLDTEQFEYNNTGNLQIKEYNNLALKSYVDTAQQNANIYTDGKVQDILTGEGLVSAEDLQKIYNLMMNTGLNYDTNNDYSLSLGYKEPFTQQYYNLISVALKSTPVQDAYTSFNPALFNNDFLGYYPVLQRLIETPNIELVKSVGIRINDEKMYAGNLYFKLSDPLQDYKLNKKFEFISHFRPLNIQSIAEYDILQTGVELGYDNYDLDNYKMRFFVASRKLNFSHNIRITNPVYEIDTTYNHLKQRFLLRLPYATPVGNDFDGARAYSVIINANTNEYFTFGIRNMPIGVPNITDDELKNIALTDDTKGWDMFLHTPKNNPDSTTAWVSPVIDIYNTLSPDDPLNVAPSKNVGKIILKFRYIKYNQPTSSWIAINPPDAQILNSFNLKWRIDFKNNVNILQPDYTEYHNFTSFNLITGTNDSYYEQIIYTSTSPEQMATTYKYVSISLEAKTPLTGNSQLYFNLQDGIRLFNVKIYPYKYTPTIYYTEQLHNIIAPTNLFEDPVDTGRYYRFVLNMDLPNHSIKYYVDNIEYSMPDTGTITLTNQSFPNAPFTTTTNATYQWTSVGETSLNDANNILVIGNIPLTGTLYFNLYNWRFINTGNFMTEAQRQSHNYLRDFKYYSNPVEVPKYLKAKEAYFDTIDFRRLLANGNVVYEELTPAEQTQLLANTDVKNVLIGNSFVNINKLYCDAGTSSGLLIYDNVSKTFNPSYTIVNNTLTFRKQYYNYLNVPTTYYDLVTIGEHPDSSSANFARVNIKGEINTIDIKISNNLTFQRDIVVGNNTYTILGGRFENFFNEETGEYFTTCFVKDLVADTARISSLKVNDFQVQGTIGQPNSAIPTLLATPSQTTARKTYGSSLDSEPAVYSTYYNKYTNDIEIYGMILRDGSYIATANDIKTIINLNNYQLISTAFNGDYNSLSNKPVLFDGNYNSLSNKPVLFDGNYNSLSNKPVLFDGNYNSLSNTPNLSLYQLISTAFDGNYNSLSNKPTLFDGNYNSLSNKPVLFDGNYNSLSNTPNLSLYQLISTAFDGNYNSLTNKPVLFDGNYNSLTDKPDLSVYQLISTAFDGNYNSLTNKPVLFDGNYNSLTDKPDLSVYQLISTAFNGDFNNLINRPSYYPIHPSIKYDINAVNDAIYIRKLSTSTCVGILKGDPIYTLDVGGTLRCNGFYSSSYINNANFSMNDNVTNAIMRINASEAGKSIIQMATPNQGTFDTGFNNKCNVVLQAIGKNTYGRADFVIGVGNSANNLNIYDPADTYFQRFRIYYNSYTEIFGTGTTATSLMRYFYVSGGLYYNSTYLTDCALRVNGSILSTSWFASSSSIKIKKDVEDLDDAECLNKLLLLKPCKYRYIDETKNFDANKKVYGFIAEEVKEVLPEAVDDTTPSLIPNIYMIGSVNNNILTLEKELELNIEYTCYIEGDNDEEGNPTAPEIKIKVLKKLDEYTYEIDKELNGRIFVYGKIEEKFNSLKKEYFHALTISAVQELHRTITRQQQEINDLKTKLNNILAHLGL